MNLYRQIMSETEHKTKIQTDNISKIIIEELEKTYGVYFNRERETSYTNMIISILLTPTYRKYCAILIELLKQYGMLEQNFLFRFMLLINQKQLPSFAKEIFENAFETLPYCTYFTRMQNGYNIKTENGEVTLYNFSQLITNKTQLYSLVLNNNFIGHCHESVEICSEYFMNDYITTSELKSLYGGTFYHSYYTLENGKGVIDISNNTYYPETFFEDYYKPNEILKIKTSEFNGEYRRLLKEVKDLPENWCPVLKLAIHNKAKTYKK